MLTTPDFPSVASRLCAACGMCCDGVLFHTVRLQPADSPKQLAALGIKLKRKGGYRCILQPCPAYRDSRCSIYHARPERCRLFECRQLRGVKSGELPESAALARIRDARLRVQGVEKLLARAGESNVKKPLSKRCEAILTDPLAAGKLRDELGKEVAELEAMLDRDFRIDTGDLTEQAEK